MPYGNPGDFLTPQQKPRMGQQGVVDLIARLQAALQGDAPASGGGNNYFSKLLDAAPVPEPEQNWFAKLLDNNQRGQIGGAVGMGGDAVGGGPPSVIDPEQALIEQLYGLITAGGGDNGMQAALHQATSGIKGAYGGQIAQIKDLNQDARHDTKVGSKEVRKMYKALQRAYNQAGKREMKQGANTAAQLERLGAGSANEATAAADKLNAQNVAAAQALGAPDIAAQLNAEVNAQQQGTANQAISQAGRSARTALGTSDNERKYYNTQGTTSRLEGTNRAADMYAQLQDYLEGNQNKIAEIAGQRAQALAAAKAQIAAAAGSGQQDMIDNLFKLTSLQHDFGEDEGGSSVEDLMKDLLPKNIYNSNALASMAPPEVQGAYQQLLNDPAMSSGEWNNQTLSDNPSAIQQWLLDNRETDSFENNPDLMAMLRNMIATYLQGHPRANPAPSPYGPTAP